MPFVSSIVQSKMVHRAVKMNDMKLLKKLVDDVDHVHSVSNKIISPCWYFDSSKCTRTSGTFICSEFFVIS